MGSGAGKETPNNFIPTEIAILDKILCILLKAMHSGSMF